MKRRDILIEIINAYPQHQQRHALDRMMFRLGPDAFTDEAILDWVRCLGKNRRMNNRLNAENRAIARGKAAKS